MGDAAYVACPESGEDKILVFLHSDTLIVIIEGKSCYVKDNGKCQFRIDSIFFLYC